VTEISFHFNMADKVAYACRLLRKAVGSGAQVAVVGEPQAMAQLDLALWTFSALDFIPHCHHDSDSSLLHASPVILAGTALPSESTQTFPVLLNLGITVPQGFERFDRLIELVGVDNDDRQGARQRWKHYSSRGYAITRHDLASKAVQ
jgi:DNA polymerase-3 subunit chi